MKQIEVVAAIFTKMSFEKGYEIFCVQRPGPKPGAEPKETDFKWEFPGGKIEEGGKPRGCPKTGDLGGTTNHHFC